LRADVLKHADVIYVHSPEMALPFVRGRGNRALVFHVHGNTNPLERSRYSFARFGVFRWTFERLMRLVMSSADAVIAVDPDGRAWAKEVLSGHGQPALEVLPTAVGPEWYAASQERDSRTPPIGSARSVVFIGRLEEAKGTGILMETLGLVMRQDESVMATVAGEGTTRLNMERRARELGVADRIAFPGWVSPDQVLVLLRSAAVLLLPSDAEGMPMCALEALAAGVPVVASAVGALPMLISNGVNGQLVPDGKASSYAEAVCQVVAESPSPRVVSDTVASYSAAQVATRLDAILETAMRHASR